MSLEHTDYEKVNSLLWEMVKNQKSNYKNLVRVFVVTFALYTVLFAFVVFMFFSFEKQFDYTTEATTETITQEISGEGNSINNVEGNQYNDNAVHNEGE